MSTAPYTLAPRFENIPAELHAMRQWIVWAHTWKDAEQKWAKVPYSPVTNTAASSTDTATWGSFDEAVTAYTASRANGTDDCLDGIGFVFTGTPYMGVDQDHVLDGEELTPGAQKIVAELSTYTEVSPSGTGVKSFMRAKKPGTSWSKITGLGLEMYDEGRYFTVTGHVLDGPVEPQERQAEVDALYYRILAERAKPVNASAPARTTPTTPPMSDEALIEKITASAQGGKFLRLYAGLTTQHNGHGKTLSGLDLLARITVGAAWPDGTPNTFGPRNVIVLSAEDANEYTIKPRIVAAGGDPSKVFVVPADKVTKLSLETDIARLRTAIETYRPLAVLIDPLSAYMPDIDTNTDSKVRSALLTFVALLADAEVSAIAIIHMSKNIERNAMQRVLGSTAFAALSRSMYMVSRDPDAHEGEEARRLFLPIKFNLGRMPEGRAFRIVSKQVSGDAVHIDTPVAEWEPGTVTAHADEVLRQLQRPSDTRKELQDAMLAVVKDGPVPVKEAKDALVRFGKSDDTLTRQRGKLGIGLERDPADPTGGGYYWTPPKWDPKAREAWVRDRMALRQPPPAGAAA